MNFKNPFSKNSYKMPEGYNQFLDDENFPAPMKFSTASKEIGDELINMRLVCYVAGGIEAVRKFDKKLFELFPKFQTELMSVIPINEENI